MIKICKTCGEPFNARPVVSVGVRVGGHKRLNCFKCKPYCGENSEPLPVAHVTRKPYIPRGTRAPRPDYYTCQCCNQVLGMRKQHLCITCRNSFNRYKYRYFCMSYKGWKCEFCGRESNRFDDFGEFDFHHTRDKLFEINKGDSFSIDVITKELDKCELLCATCHRCKHKKDIPKWFIENISRSEFKGQKL